MQEKEQKISPIKERILQFVDTLGISKRDFYKIIDVSRGTLESKTGITEDVLAKFIAKYPDINLNWLISGDGNMYNNIHVSDEDFNKAESLGMKLIPEVSFEFSAGPVLLINDESIIRYWGMNNEIGRAHV